MLGDLRAKDLSIISRASHSLKRVSSKFILLSIFISRVWYFDLFYVCIFILTSVWGTGRDGSHIACKPLQPRFLQPTDVSPDRFNSCENELESWEDSPGMYRLSLFATEMLPTSSSLASLAISVKVFRMTNTSGHCLRISNSWNLTDNKEVELQGNINSNLSYFWSQML